MFQHLRCLQLAVFVCLLVFRIEANFDALPCCFLLSLFKRCHQPRLVAQVVHLLFLNFELNAGYPLPHLVFLLVSAKEVIVH